MGKIKNPKLFSKEFHVDPRELKKRKLLDPILNGDTRLFIDPILLSASKNPIIQKAGLAQFTQHFGNVIRLLKVSKAQGDLPWRNAGKILTLNELPELCLGYGGNSTRGRRLAKATRIKVLSTAKEIVDLGVDDPELFSLIGLLEEGVGPDTIGDMTANAVIRALVEITTEAAKELGVTTKGAHIAGLEARLPFNKEANKSVLLVPTDILRDLPVAADWSDISAAASENEKIRTRVNDLIGDIWKHTLKKQKDEIRQAALSSKDAFRTVLDAAYLLKDSSYDFDADPDGHRIFRETLLQFAVDHPLKLTNPETKNATELRKIVDQIICHFKQLIEHNGINYLLWDGKVPRKEKAAQRLFFAVADVYCKANNIDISPETDSGGGPVDFKFSFGYDGRLLVEIKLSTGTVMHGYSTQLGVYEEAAKTFESIFLIIDVGGLRPKLETILDQKNKKSAQDKRTPEIVVVDAKIKASASKR
jgi:hypothetical protein